MEALTASLQWPSAFAWSAFALSAGMALVGQVWRHGRLAFRKWQLDRRLARDPYILREEMNEYLLAVGDEGEPPSPPAVIRNSILTGLLGAIPVWLIQNDLEHWWEIGVIGVCVLSLLGAWWRWLNDPESDPAALKLPKATVPVEAMLGFAGAILTVGVILGLIWLL